MKTIRERDLAEHGIPKIMVKGRVVPSQLPTPMNVPATTETLTAALQQSGQARNAAEERAAKLEKELLDVKYELDKLGAAGISKDVLEGVETELQEALEEARRQRERADQQAGELDNLHNSVRELKSSHRTLQGKITDAEAALEERTLLMEENDQLKAELAALKSAGIGLMSPTDVNEIDEVKRLTRTDDSLIIEGLSNGEDFKISMKYDSYRAFRRMKPINDEAA